MSKKKSVPVWLTVLEGVGIALGVYLGAQLLLALLLVKGVAGEGVVLPVEMAVCALAVLAGALFAMGRTALGALVCAMSVSGGFVGILLLVGLGVYGQLALAGNGGVLLAAALLAGLGAGLVGGRKKRRRSRGRRA